MSLRVGNQTAFHSINEFSDEFIHGMAERILVYLAVGIDRMEGKTFEKFVCDIYNTEWRGSNDGLIDVHLKSPTQNIGLSLKSLFFRFTKTLKDPAVGRNGERKTIRTTLGRNAPSSKQQKVYPNETPADEAGEIVTSIWNERLSKAIEECGELRVMTFLKSSDLSRWMIFEYLPKHYDASEISWEWVTRKSKKKLTTNLQGYHGNTHLTWQPHGSQFSLTQPIPEGYTEFSLKKPNVIPRDKILSMIGHQADDVSIKHT